MTDLEKINLLQHEEQEEKKLRGETDGRGVRGLMSELSSRRECETGNI